MSDLMYTLWYREGEVKLTRNSNIVEGTNTLWQSGNITPGDIFVAPGFKLYEVREVISDGEIRLSENWEGSTVTGQAYAVIRNFTATSSAKVSAQAADLFTKFAKYIDSDMSTLTGMSAYDQAKSEGFTGTLSEWLESLSGYGVAVSQGYKGTKAEWLESLKAAGEWTAIRLEADEIQSKLKAPYIFLGYLNKAEGNETREGMLIRRAHEKNMHLRQKSLGEFTDAYRNMIADGSYLFTDDIQLGDYWTAESTFTPPEGVDWTGDKDKPTTWVENDDGTVTIERHWQVVDFALPYSGGSMSHDIDNPGGNGHRHISLAVMPVEPLFADKMTPYDDKPEAGWTSGGYYSSRYFSKTWETARSIADGVFPSMLCHTMSYWQTYGNFTEGKGFTRYVGNSRYSATASHGDGRHVIVRNYTEAQAKKLHTQAGGWLTGLGSTYDEMLPTYWNIFGCRYSDAVSIPPLLGAQYHHLAYFRMGGLRSRWATVHYQDELVQNQGGFGSCWLQDAVSADEYLALVGNNPQFCTPVSADAQLGIRPIFTIHLVV